MRAFAVLVLLIPCCNREQTTRHEALAKALAAPMARLCESRHQEGGGCNGDCIPRLAAIEARAAFDASNVLFTLAKVDDPETEKLLEPVRESAREVKELIGTECPAAIGEEEPVTPEVTRCAKARAKIWAPLAKLYDGVDTLAARTKDRTGVVLPSLSSCPPT